MHKKTEVLSSRLVGCEGEILFKYISTTTMKRRFESKNVMEHVHHRAHKAGAANMMSCPKVKGKAEPHCLLILRY